MHSQSPQVLSEIHGGHGLGMSAAARLIPGVGGGSVNSSTLFRWVVNGIKLPDGRRLKLEAVRIGHRLITSGPALERFILQTTASHDPELNSIRSPAQRTRASARAEKELREMGV